MKTEIDVVSTATGPDTQPGCLLQIHPVAMNGGLIRLSEEEIVVGRDDNCGLPLRDRSASRRHATILHAHTDAYVRDLGSTNGTWVNDIRTGEEPFRLVAGDRVRFGTHVFKYLSANDIETQYHAAAYAMMTRDGSTGTLNKQSLFDHFDREISRALHRQRALSLILLDVDYFKSVNDRYGHLAGDEVLRELCAQIHDQISDEVLFARFGGEEFAILLPEEVGESAAEVAEGIRRTIEETEFNTCGGSIRVTVSLGVVEMAEVMHLIEGEDTRRRRSERFRNELRSEMLECCDQRLYRAKTAGRNRVVNQ
ncbi:MAG: GGDEF domain-containing protein [Planctomycetota bacterium]